MTQQEPPATLPQVRLLTEAELAELREDMDQAGQAMQEQLQQRRPRAE